MPLGFILQPTYRIESNRPVVHLYGKLDSGESFLIRDDRPRPHFWIPDADAERAGRLGADVEVDRPALESLDRRPLVRVKLDTPQQAPPLRDRLRAQGIECFEADVRFAYRYLIDRGIRSTLEIDGPEHPGNGVDVVFENPRVRPTAWIPELTVLSLDIETDPRARTLYSIGLSGCGADEVLLYRPHGDAPPNAVAFRSERELLRAFVCRVRELDPDVLTGWNVIGFDLAVLSRIAGRCGVRMTLGRGTEPLRVRSSGTPRGGSQAFLPGRVVLDGIDLLRGAFIKMESYALNAVAQTLLGRGKTITGSDRAGEITRRWKEDPQALADYNLVDAQLVLDILERLRLIPLTVERSLLTGMPPDRVAASVASFDFLYLSELARRGRAAPLASDQEDLEEQSGGHVLSPRTGLHHNVLLFDFQSLYPSVVRTFNIDPLAMAEASWDDNPIEAPNGATFSRDPGILPGLLNELTPQRAAAKQAGDEVKSQAIKILMNSFYGVLGTSACRFAFPGLANAITGFGREILLWSKARFEALGFEVLYGDTDSLFVASGTLDPDEAATRASQLEQTLNDELAAHVQEIWGLKSRLVLEFERLYLRLVFPEVKSRGSEGARKRYAGLVQTEDGDEVILTGLEAVRRDWTGLARRAQRDLFERLFRDRDVTAYLRELVADLRRGKFDEELVYRKNLRRDLDSYTTTTPPHVAAARKMDGPAPRVVRYHITVNGPEPTVQRKSAIDYEHYVQKQVRGAAEPVLAILGLDFDQVIGDDTQMRLF
jgi:DNA polymerase-2